jgi:hypothetical protein
MAWVRRAGILLVVLAVALGLGGATAGAKKKHHKKKGKPWASKVSLTHPSNTQFKGDVDSSLGACRSSRVVILFFTDPNTARTTPLSVQRTDGKGHYSVALTTPTYPGQYQVEVIQRKIRAMHAPQRCLDATSGVITV